jgi:acyl dehydratase
VSAAVARDTIAPAIVGAEVGPIAHEIDARWLMAYAAALGERDPRYFDTLAPHGPLAHPLFSVCYEWPVAVAIRDATIAAELQPRSVHATHDLVIHRAPRAGDRLRTVARVTDVRDRRSGTLIVTHFVTTDTAGDPVTTTDYGSVYRGVSMTGVSPRDVDEPSPRAQAAGGPEAPSANAVLSEGASGPPAAVIDWREVVDVPATLALVYTECARIWNPIHTDVAVARAAGLPAPILHGTATLALAVSRTLAHDRRGDPSAVAEVSARFTGMVAMPSTLTVRGRDRQDDGIGFDVVNEAGAPVLTAGRIRFRPTR